jgi:hypothetical protein
MHLVQSGLYSVLAAIEGETYGSSEEARTATVKATV